MTMTGHCPNCPLETGAPCPGEEARRTCDLVDPSHRDHRPNYKDSVRRTAAQRAAGAPSHPGPLAMAGHALAAAGRVLVAAAKGRPIRVEPAVYRERLEICRSCQFNSQAPSGVRCTKCGCGGLKLELATERCPLDPPRWQADRRHG